MVDIIFLRLNIARLPVREQIQKFMELKVACGCGQKYKFDVEPVGGRMPVRVACPSCGVDGTDTANNLLSQNFPNQTSAIPIATVAPAAKAIPAAPVMAAAPVGGGLRINATPPAINAPASVAAPKPIAPIAPAFASKMKAPPKDDFSLGLGILGAILGAALGAGLMYGFFLIADFRFPLMGTCIGALSGLGARILARGTDSSLGIAAGAVALFSTAGTLYLMYGNAGGLFIISMAVSVYFAYRVAA